MVVFSMQKYSRFQGSERVPKVIRSVYDFRHVTKRSGLYKGGTLNASVSFGTSHGLSNCATNDGTPKGTRSAFRAAAKVLSSFGQSGGPEISDNPTQRGAAKPARSGRSAAPGSRGWAYMNTSSPN